MDFDQIKKNARGFVALDKPDQTASVKASRRPAAARVSPMSAAQQKVYRALTADNGFSVQDARRQFLSAGEDQKLKAER